MDFLLHVFRHVPELMVALAVAAIQVQFGRWLVASEPARRSRPLRRAFQILTALVVVWLLFGFASYLSHRPVRAASWWSWLRGGALAWSLASFAGFAIALAWRRVPRFNPRRRDLLRLAGGAVVAAPYAAIAYGTFIQRRAFRVREVEVGIPNLARDLQGLRLVQLSDIHLSPFLSRRELARVVDMANELKAHLALVTGDLITSHGDPLDACLSQLARLRTDAGILGCLGNHEIYAGAEQAATVRGARLGIRFLRQASERLRFGNATLNVVGVDYQRMNRPYLAGAEKLVVPGTANILLSHNSDVFDVAARQGYQLTISGHTHGGQISIEILDESLNVARFFTPYIYGLYRTGPASIWVTRGIGTVGVPTRIGAPPEVALIRLCAT